MPTKQSHTVKLSHDVYLALVAKQTEVLQKTGVRPTLDAVVAGLLVRKK